MKRYTIVGLAIAALLPVSAYALSVSGAVDSSSDASLGVSNTLNAGLNAGVEGSVGANTDSGAATSGSSDSDAGFTTSGSLSVIVVTRADIEGDGEANASPTSVRSNADLSGYVAAQVANDENVSKVETSADNVSVTYKQRAQLFGLVQVTVDATATVRADGSVDVRYPWYAFLMVTNEGELEAAIEERVKGFVSASADATAEASVGLDASAQAELIDDVRAVMESRLAADVNASANAVLNGSVE